MSDEPSTDDDANDPRTGWLLRHEPWLKLLARLEIDSRFQGKFSASDAVQQTLAAAWRDWANCRATSDQQRLAWLRKILANQLGQLARQFTTAQRRDVRREISLEHSLAESSQRLERFLAADQTSPSGAAVANEEQTRLAEVLECLPADYRDVLILRHIEELPFDEIAARLDRSPGAVRMLWVRALARLRDELERS
ncbi:MAG TPA: sigma-70 family RNA polymerase sigma factor [Pirellulales bacterium]|nr:sigma-70 family RNA polymerase sigma factor [Pirellulales bacterium]